MKTSDLIARCLENEGVRCVFGVPGEEILDIVDSLADSRVRFIPTRHEQGAAFMADAYGRLTGRAGVCLSTLGPGATNLATGVADANLDHAPLVALTGQAGRDRIHKESHQYVDIVEHLRPLTKWNARAEMPVVIPEVIRKAFKVAEAEKPGPATWRCRRTWRRRPRRASRSPPSGRGVPPRTGRAARALLRTGAWWSGRVGSGRC